MAEARDGAHRESAEMLSIQRVLRIEGQRLGKSERRMMASFGYVPIRVTVPGGVAFATSAFDSENAFLKPAIADV
jgi:hypothetical protein